MSNKPIITSRRNVLLGIGAVGVASAGAGLGTTAYFSDTESFSGNSLQAGEFDLRVRYAGQYNEFGEPMFGQANGVIDGVNSTIGTSPVSESDFGFVVDDLKPGDDGKGEFCFQINDNPGYLTIAGAAGTDSENGYTEPEPTTAGEGDINTPGDSGGEGELQDALMVYVSYSDGSYTDDGTISYVGSRGDIFSGTLREFFAGEYLFDADPSTPVADPVPGMTDGWHDVCVLFELEVPTAVGNEIQSDSLEFSVDFTAVQARHNLVRASDADSGFVDVAPSVNQNGGYGDGGESFASKTMTARARYGDVNTYEVATGGSFPSGDQQEVDWGALNGTTLPFVFSYDGAGGSTFDIGNGAVVSSASGLGAPAGRVGLQAKVVAGIAATVDVQNVALSADGTQVSFVGPDGVTAENDATARDIQYLVLETAAADLADGFVLSGDVTVTLPNGYNPAGQPDEAVAFDVVVE